MPEQWVGAWVAAVMIAGGVAGVDGGASVAPSPDGQDGQQVVIAHRGSSGEAPEHTMPAYRRAVADGADYVEQDVALTRDGVLVALHDRSLDRTARGPAADCTGDVGTRTLAQLTRCDVGTWFNERYPGRADPAFAGVRIPTLERVLARLGDQQGLYIETKAPRPDGATERELVRLLAASGRLGEGGRVLIQSFSAESLRRVRALDPGARLVQLFVSPSVTQLEQAAEYAEFVGVASGAVTPELVRSAHELGLAVHAYTARSTRDIERLGSMCVDGIFVDHPERYRSLIEAGTFEECGPPLAR